MKTKLLLIPIGLMSFIIPIKITSLILDHSKQFDNASFSQEYQRQTQQRESFNQKIALNLGALNRAQQAHFFETRKFADSYQELGWGLSEADNNYRVTIERKNDSSFIYAVAKNNFATYKEWDESSWVDAKEPLYSYISAIAYDNNGTFQSILCVSQTVGKHKLEKPKMINGKFNCAPGIKELP